MSTQQRIRIRYTKEHRVRFVSARDMTAVWERALRRADLPIAYSEGFHPHAKVSFPDALPVGFASTGEYAELTFAAPIDPGPDLGRLSATLPAGMDVTTYQEVPDGASKLARYLRVTLWELVYPSVDASRADETVDALQRYADAAMAATELTASRERPDGIREIAVRPALLSIAAFARTSPDHHDVATGSGSDAVIPHLRAVLTNDGPTVRPTDLHQAIERLVSEDTSATALPAPRLFRRVAQGALSDGGIHEALTEQFVALRPARLVEAA